MKAKGLANILHLVEILSQALHHEELLKEVVSICLGNTEADYCLVLQNQDGRLFVQGEGTMNPEHIEVGQMMPIDSISRLKKNLIYGQKVPAFIVEKVFKSQKPAIIRDFSQHTDDPYVQLFKPKASFCVPIMYNGFLHAIIYLDARQTENAFPVETEELVTILSKHIGIAFQNAVLYREKHSKLQEAKEEKVLEKDRVAQFQEQIKLLEEIGQEITSHFTIKEITQSVYENVSALMESTVFSIGIYNPTEGTIDMPCAIEQGKTLAPHSYSLQEKDRLAVLCYTEKREIVLNDFYTEYHRLFHDMPPVDPKTGGAPSSVLYLPILAKGETIGVVTVQSFRKFAYSDIHLAILRNLAVYIAIAIENMYAYQQLQDSREELEWQKTVIEEQKEKVTAAYNDIQLLAELGQEITTKLDMEHIIETAQKSLGYLLDATIFTIGIYNEEKNLLEMPLTIEAGSREPYHFYDLSKDEPRLATWCFRNQKAVFMGDYLSDFSDYFKDIPVSMPMVGQLPQSVMYLPIQNKDKTIGVISVQSFDKNAYTQYHLNFLKNMAVYVGIAVENADAYENIKEGKERLQETFNQVKVLGEIGQEITAFLDIEKILETVYESINTLMDAPIFSVGIYNAETESIDVPVSIHKHEKQSFISHSIHDDTKISVRCFTDLKEVIINDLAKDLPRYFPRMPIPRPSSGEVPESLVFLPLIGKNTTVGVLSVQSFIKGAYEEQELNLLRNLAIYVAIALENADAYQKIEESRQEIEQQRKLVDQGYKNMQLLADIGQEIMANLSVEKIIASVYENINSIVDASVFWIGIYDETQHALTFRGGKEKGETLEDFTIHLSKEERLATWCFNNQKEVLVNDVNKDYSKYVRSRIGAVVGDSPESIIYMPMSIKQRRIGVLTVQSFSPNAYRSHHLEILRNLVNYLVTALENAFLYENMEEKVKSRTSQVVKQKEELEVQRDQIDQSFQSIKLLSEIGQEITSIRATDKIIRAVYDNVNDLMDATTFGIGLLNQEKDQIIFRGAVEEGEELPEFHHDANDDMRFSSWSLQNKQAVFINDFENEYQKYIPGMKKASAGKESKSILYLPLSTKNGEIGVITIQSYENNAYTPYHLDLMKNLAVYVGIALENAEAYQQIERSTKAVEAANHKITASINYAKRIQDSILPDKETIRKALSDFMVLYKPRDIVSGDFYWYREQHGKHFLAAMDCTGHGVPGAFMSMIGNDLLNEIITYLNFEEPDYILAELHQNIREVLRQEQTDSREGMDLALCVIDPIANRVHFSGAKRPLIYIRNGEIHIINGDRLAIGGRQREDYRTFTKHSIDVEKGDVFYVFSDGYQDQFGGPRGRKLMSKRFKQFLLEIHELPLSEQRDILDQRVEDWKGKERQTDDILVLGFRV